MPSTDGDVSRATSVEFSKEPVVREERPRTRPATSPLDRALRATQDALGEVTKVAMGEIRLGGEASPHIEAADRDLRGALKQLGLAKRSSGRGPKPEA